MLTSSGFSPKLTKKILVDGLANVSIYRIAKLPKIMLNRGVNLVPSPWASTGPLFIKPLKRPPNEGAKKKPQPPKPPL